MEFILILAVVILVFEAVGNTRECFMVYKTGNDTAKFMELHSQINEGAELVGFVLIGILLYLSNFNSLLVGIALVLGLYHLPPTVISNEGFSNMPDKILNIMPRFVMIMCAVEVILSIYIITKIIPVL
jgi:hypothetical protein